MDGKYFANAGCQQMNGYTDLWIVVSIILFFWVYFKGYSIYCIYRNHNKVMKVRIKENRQMDFYDAEKIKNSIQDRMFISAFLYILSAVIGYSLLEKRVGDNLFFSTGLAFSVVIFLTGMIVKKILAQERGVQNTNTLFLKLME